MGIEYQILTVWFQGKGFVDHHHGVKTVQKHDGYRRSSFGGRRRGL